MDSDNEEILPSINSDPANLINQMTYPTPPPLTSMTKTFSRSVPNSRRNSSDDHIDLLLNAKLSLNEPYDRKLSLAQESTNGLGTNMGLHDTVQSNTEGAAFFIHHPPVSKHTTAIKNLFPVVTTLTESTSNVWSPSFTSKTINPLLPESISGPTRRYSYEWNPEINDRYGNDSFIAQSRQSTYSTTDSMNHRRSMKEVQRQYYPMDSVFLSQELRFHMTSPATPSLYQQHTLSSHGPLLQTPFSASSLNTTYQKTKDRNGRHAKHDMNYSVNRRSSANQDRFVDANVSDFAGRLYDLCKDQNGCRFLQRKIEENANEELDLIFNDIYSHFAELMIDPFGNYLCQKLLEKCNDEQRIQLIQIIRPHLIDIALNMHGTRAIQRLVECVSTHEQIQYVISALSAHVAPLIKNLNGNHVIQKCLRHLSSEYNQFIYNAVCKHCVEIASHKHGCCVLQRCLDFATPQQKDQLVGEISKHTLVLVQDPFGNYVVQYILDLQVPNYIESINQHFIHHVCTLSIQKFSSNVIEKCIRTASPQTRRLLVHELIECETIDKLVQDSFANYVIQTSLDYADEDQREQLVYRIRPFLSTIRHAPHGKRIYSRIISHQRQNKDKILQK
ncbi:hypothetical protein G6F70_006970 [Rhizopus microsporus]|uniref:PUM-HD domain-containing protein n=2 Tax=Rhizopus TaxID=4842 RepID=A0A367JL19_RHIAZ|nr:hypothetical protein G6F71_007551 [Rhizopus microsporus]RCH90585.1 hypothetical protein CU097_008690 [Rhizopus azygosporus]KAG1197014.1 hypothetical protein G6F70_006970 [Rhizopus microsporus]KAG1208061.1 hypothetical protein G6F69_007538 [Rhizopus microsporus]KAG1229155.1 hypothetical protein G6F67_007349 [Rhizopus microsporus]